MTSSLESCAIPDGKFSKLFDVFKKLLEVAQRVFSELTKFTVSNNREHNKKLGYEAVPPKGLSRPKNTKYKIFFKKSMRTLIFFMLRFRKSGKAL